SGQLLHTGGRWFSAGIAAYDEIELMEILPAASAEPRRIAIDPLDIPDGGSQPQLQLLTLFALMRPLALVDAGNALVLGVSRGFPTTKLNAHRQPGDTQPAVAATYRIGCAAE